MSASLLNLLQGQIDITQVPFSDRGSRILVNQVPGDSRLYIKLAERLTSFYPGLETYLQRPPFIRDLCLIDQRGSTLAFDVISSAEMLRLRTRIGDFHLLFQDKDTLALGLPPNTISGLRFHAQAESHTRTATGGKLKYARNLTCATSGNILRNIILPQEAGCVVEIVIEADNNDCAITLQVNAADGISDAVLPFSTAYKNAVKRWRDWFEPVPPISEPYRQKYAYAWWVMADNLVSPLGYLEYEAMMPTKAFYVGIWLWDSALHAIALRHAHPALARDQLRVMLVHQLPDGMLPNAIFDEGVVSEIEHPIRGRVTKPPILAWAALKLHESDPNLGFLREIYPALVRCNDWWLGTDHNATKLAEYAHPYSSGLDNSPLWDHGIPVESPDINTYLTIQMDSLAAIAELLGDNEAATIWRRRASALAQRMLEDLWDEKASVFNARQNQNPIPVLTPFNLYPLWTGHLPGEIAKRLSAHLKDPYTFAGEYMIPTVARNDPAYTLESMWRGRLWANINYFFVEALEKAGEVELARELRHKTLNMIMAQPGIHEYYNPETGVPPATAAAMFAWTAAVFIELALQAAAESKQKE